MKASLAFVFPGQGSQAVSMLADIGAAESVVAETFAEASAALGYDLWALCQQGPAEILNQTDKTQPAILTASIALWRLWLAKGRSEEHTSELQSRPHLVCRLLLEKKKTKNLLKHYDRAERNI